MALPLTVEQAELALPPVGTAGSVEITKLISGRLKEQLEDPESLLLPKTDWPEPRGPSQTNLADASQWQAMAQLLWSRGIVTRVPESEVFAPQGQPVVSGRFGVGQRQQFAGH